MGEMTLKALPGASEYTVQGYGVIFNRRDLMGEEFTADTDYGVSRTLKGLPVFYDHALRGIKSSIGTVRSYQFDDTGIFFEIELDRHHEYIDEVMRLLREGALGLSTGTMPHTLIKSGGIIKRWILGEISLTPTPAEYETLLYMETKTMTDNETVMEEEMQGTSEEDTSVEASTETTREFLSDIKKFLASMGSDLRNLREELDSMKTAAPPAKKRSPVPSHAAKPSPVNPEEDVVKSFDFYIRTGYRKGLQENTDSEGGYLVPRIYSDTLVRQLNDMSIMRSAGARVVSTQGTNSFRQAVMTDSDAATIVSEEGSFPTTSNPAFTEVEFVPRKYSKLVKVTDELAADSQFDIMSQVILPDYQQSFAAAENNAFFVGSGTAEPKGVTQTTNTYSLTNPAITADDIIAMFYQLNHMYSQNAVWFMSNTVISLIHRLTTDDGTYLWSNSLQDGQPPRLLGKPVYTVDVMDSTIAEDNVLMVFGNPKYYQIVDFGSMSMKRLEELYAGNGQVGFRAYRRMDGNILLNEAFVSMVVS